MIIYGLSMQRSTDYILRHCCGAFDGGALLNVIRAICENQMNWKRAQNDKAEE